jgi:hypothetical protein
MEVFSPFAIGALSIKLSLGVFAELHRSNDADDPGIDTAAGPGPVKGDGDEQGK